MEAVIDWDALEEAGHDLTYCGMIMPGSSLYYCENCGALMLTGQDGVVVFHVHRGSLSEQGRCHNDVPTDGPTLKEKLDVLRLQDWERLRKI